MSLPADFSRSLDRRAALRMLIGAAGAGCVPMTAHGVSDLVGRHGPDAAFPRGSIIRSVLKDLPPESLSGSILFHEHLSGTTRFSDDVELMVAEATAARKDGLACIVDGGHPDFKFTPGGYRLDSLKRIAAESSLPVVASGGYYAQQSYPADLAGRTAEDIAETLIMQAAAGHLGAFGEMGQQGGVLTDTERKVFRAVAMAHLKTRLPIFTHNAYVGRRQTAQPIPRDAALRQLDALEAAGAPPNRIAIGHLCCLDDPGTSIAKSVAARGAFVGFDRVTLESISLPDADRVVMAMELVHAGYAKNLLLSSDFFAESSLKRNGGAGLAQAATVFGPKLLKAGLAESTLRMILEDNPRRFLAFVPPA